MNTHLSATYFFQYKNSIHIIHNIYYESSQESLYNLTNKTMHMYQMWDDGTTTKKKNEDLTCLLIVIKYFKNNSILTVISLHRTVTQNVKKKKTQKLFIPNRLDLSSVAPLVSSTLSRISAGVEVLALPTVCCSLSTWGSSVLFYWTAILCCSGGEQPMPVCLWSVSIRRYVWEVPLLLRRQRVSSKRENISNGYIELSEDTLKFV